MADKKETELMDEVINLSRSRGFIFPGSEVYGGLANSYDFGPLGAQLKRNIKNLWWKRFVQQREDMVGLDANIIMNTKVWEASGHLEGFNDILIECKECHERFRADEVIEDFAKKGKSSLKSLVCEKCGTKGKFTQPTQFNTMFKTNLGPVESEDNVVYLRPETAQAMFVDFPEIVRATRKKIPFGVAQIGKAFRNEITPGNFIFRLREFEQMEIEYFIPPPKAKKDWEKHFEYWAKQMKAWLKDLGVDMKKVKEVEISKEERAHYSKRTVDFEFVYPFGQKELYGLAYRTDYDIAQHEKHSGKKMKYQDPEGNEYIPHVIEPTFGVERTILAVLLSVYTKEKVKNAKGEEENRVLMKFPKEIAPYKVAVLPLSKKPKLNKLASEIRENLSKKWMVDYDTTQSIGKRYRRQDEIGTPYCVTIDFDSLEDKKVTVRDRDSMKQDRVKISSLEDYLSERLQ